MSAQADTTAKSKQALLPAYLVFGADELKRQTVIKRLRERISKEGDLSFDSDQFSGESAEGQAIVASCNTLPFASPVRLVQVDAVEKLKGADQDAVVDYLASPCETTVLCLVSANLTKNTRLYKAVAKVGDKAIIDCTPVKRRQLPDQVRAMAVTHGVAITPSAANMLIDLVGESTVALDAALAKIALAHVGIDPVNDAEVSSSVARTAEAKPWEFVDAFSARNARKCVMLRQRMPSVSPHSLLAMCTTRIRDLIVTQSLINRGQIGQLAGYLGMKDWQVKNYPTWARAFGPAQLRDALKQSRDTEKAMKSGTDAESAFQDWYLSVICHREH